MKKFFLVLIILSLAGCLAQEKELSGPFYTISEESLAEDSTLRGGILTIVLAKQDEPIVGGAKLNGSLGDARCIQNRGKTSLVLTAIGSSNLQCTIDFSENYQVLADQVCALANERLIDGAICIPADGDGNAFVAIDYDGKNFRYKRKELAAIHTSCPDFSGDWRAKSDIGPDLFNFGIRIRQESCGQTSISLIDVDPNNPISADQKEHYQFYLRTGEHKNNDFTVYHQDVGFDFTSKYEWGYRSVRYNAPMLVMTNTRRKNERTEYYLIEYGTKEDNVLHVDNYYYTGVAGPSFQFVRIK